ncbi:MAG: helix-turn-helix transcriptional regulator [Spirochaetota bacterium]
MESVTELLDILEKIMDTLAGTFGDSCEVVLHDLKGMPYDHSIIAIRNGHITGRKVGDPSTNKGLEFLRNPNPERGDEIGYITKTATGKTLRSSSIYFRNSSQEVIGSLCINLDISQLLIAENSLRNLMGLNPAQVESENKEFFARDINSLLTDSIQASMEHVGKPSSLMNKDEKCQGIRYLDERGVFLIKKSGEQVCASYEISKNALYSFLEEIRKPKEEF